MYLSDLENAVLEKMRERTPEDAHAIQSQILNCRVLSRENTKVGFYTELSPKVIDIRLRNKIIGDVFAKLNLLKNPIVCVLFIKNGIIETLEGASIDENTGLINFTDVKFEILD